MKNYTQNRNTPSRSFYINELKKTPKNLTINNNQLDFLEKKLDKLLTHSFKFFHPFFNDDEYEINKNYYKAGTDEGVDDEFDKQVEKHLPKWALVLINLLNIIYNRIIGTKLIKYLTKKTIKTINNLNNIQLNKQILKTRKFFAFKSPP